MKGFTLIELLVVVLIIGILAAIALPTYMKAVEKSRASEAIVLLKKLLDAESVYYLANGGYTKDLNALDITMPNISSDEDDNIRSYGKNFIVGVSYAHSDMIVAQAERIGVASGKRYYINLRRNNAGGEALWCTSSWGAYMPTSDNLPNAEWAALCKAISNGKKNGVSYNTLVEE